MSSSTHASAAGHLLTLATLRLLTTQPQGRFTSVRSVPLQVLTELTAKYLELLAGAAARNAQRAGRVDANARDVVEAIEQFGHRIAEVQEWSEERRGLLEEELPLDDPTVRPGGEQEHEQEHEHQLVVHHPASSSSSSSLARLLLKDTAHSTSERQPIQILEFGPLTRDEEEKVAALEELAAKTEEEDDDDSSDDDRHPRTTKGEDEMDMDREQDEEYKDVDARSPPPSYSHATAVHKDPLYPCASLVKREGGSADPDDTDPLAAFLPPIPDLTAGLETVQTIEEDESGRIVKRARKALIDNVAGSSSIWQRVVPFESSSLAEYQTQSLPDPSSLPSAAAAAALSKSANGSLPGAPMEDLASTSSLLYFLETFNYVSLDAQVNQQEELEPLRPNPKRKRAATAIHSNILNPSDDSLSGAIPTPQPRHAKKQAGWIPYPPLSAEAQDPSEPSGKALQPFPPLHPFSTQLPPTVTEPVPTVVLPHATRVLAPIMHPRYPTAHSSIRTLLEQSQTALFNRTTRLGPPGPLMENGAAGHYEIELEKPVIAGWPGETAPRMMAWNFDWEIANEHEESFKPSFPPVLPSGTSTPAGGAVGSGPGPSSGAGIQQQQRAGTPAFTPENTGPAFPQLPLRQINQGPKIMLSYRNQGGQASRQRQQHQQPPPSQSQQQQQPPPQQTQREQGGQRGSQQQDQQHPQDSRNGGSSTMGGPSNHATNGTSGWSRDHHASKDTTPQGNPATSSAPTHTAAPESLKLSLKARLPVSTTNTTSPASGPVPTVSEEAHDARRQKDAAAAPLPETAPVSAAQLSVTEGHPASSPKTDTPLSHPTTSIDDLYQPKIVHPQDPDIRENDAMDIDPVVEQPSHPTQPQQQPQQEESSMSSAAAEQLTKNAIQDVEGFEEIDTRMVAGPSQAGSRSQPQDGEVQQDASLTAIPNQANPRHQRQGEEVQQEASSIPRPATDSADDVEEFEEIDTAMVASPAHHPEQVKDTLATTPQPDPRPVDVSQEPETDQVVNQPDTGGGGGGEDHDEDDEDMEFEEVPANGAGSIVQSEQGNTSRPAQEDPSSAQPEPTALAAPSQPSHGSDGQPGDHGQDRMGESEKVESATIQPVTTTPAADPAVELVSTSGADDIFTTANAAHQDQGDQPAQGRSTDEVVAGASGLESVPRPTTPTLHDTQPDVHDGAQTEFQESPTTQQPSQTSSSTLESAKTAPSSQEYTAIRLVERAQSEGASATLGGEAQTDTAPLPATATPSYEAATPAGSLGLPPAAPPQDQKQDEGRVQQEQEQQGVPAVATDGATPASDLAGDTVGVQNVQEGGDAPQEGSGSGSGSVRAEPEVEEFGL